MRSSMPPANDPDAALAADLQNPDVGAQNRVIAASGTDAALAADAQTYGPQVGVHPDVAVHVLPQVKQQAKLQQNQAVVAGSPDLQGWLRNADDTAVAAVQDSLPHIANILSGVRD